MTKERDDFMEPPYTLTVTPESKISVQNTPQEPQCKWCEQRHKEAPYGNPTVQCIKNLRSDLNLYKNHI